MTTLNIQGQEVQCELVRKTKHTKQYKPVVNGYFKPIAEASDGFGKRLIVLEIKKMLLFLSTKTLRLKRKSTLRLGNIFA